MIHNYRFEFNKGGINMAKDPAFLFYSSDFLTGTVLMDNEQVGKYIKLMCLQHQKGHLTEKDMLKICGEYDELIFSKFDKDTEGLYYNERLDKEITKRKKYSESRRKNRRKKEDMKQICDTYVPHMENENIYINNNLNNNLNNNKKKIRGINNKKHKRFSNIKEWQKAKIEELKKIHFAERVAMTNDEYKKLVVAHGKEVANQCIEKLNNYKISKGKSYKNDYRAILSWVVDCVKGNKIKASETVTNAYRNIEQEEYNNLDRFYV